MSFYGEETSSHPFLKWSCLSHCGVTQGSHLCQVQFLSLPHILRKKKQSNNYSLSKTWVFVLNNYEVL